MFKFSIMFVALTVAILAVAGVATYFSQMRLYKKQCENRVRNVGVYLSELMKAEGDIIIDYRNYFMKHYKEMDIPIDIDNYAEVRKDFEEAFIEKYPGKVFDKDIKFEDMDPEVQKAFIIDTHVYWLLTFEKAREVYDLPYTYFLVMADSQDTIDKMGYDVEFVQGEGKEDRDNVVYMIDGERTERDDSGYMYLGDTYYNPREKYGIMWKTWDTGEKQDGYMEWDNAWGHTYGYYTPLVINGEKVGLVVSEVDVASVNHDIMQNTIKQLGIIVSVFILGLVIMLMVIKARFVSRTGFLESKIAEYSKSKDPRMAEVIRKHFNGKDELDSLGGQFAGMITDLTSHIDNLIKTSNELRNSQMRAEEMTELANKDALTGIRNKNAYDNEIQKLQLALNNGETAFGLGMVDLNFLKSINDNYGHEKGNVAIKLLCRIVCTTFDHSPVFRIGGDEFVIVLKNADFRIRDELVKKFEDQLNEIANDESRDPWERVSAAIGIAVYDPEKDKDVQSVFRRADEAMYARKKEMKTMRQE